MEYLLNKQDLLLDSLIDFYNKDSKKNVGILKTIIEQKSVISLRLLDWLTTNYSKQHNIYYNVGINLFNLHNDYKNQLKAYSKKLFDPFCRRHRIFIIVDSVTFRILRTSLTELQASPDESVLITTVGQLNFFRWAIKYNVASYTIKHHRDIEIDMLARNTTKKKQS